MSDRASEWPCLPKRWQELESNKTYHADSGLLVAFSQTQIQLGMVYDSLGKHLRAIHKGIVPPKGNSGLVPSEETDYDLKTKILGKGGDRRFHGKMANNILYFPGKQTTN